MQEYSHRTGREEIIGLIVSCQCVGVFGRSFVFFFSLEFEERRVMVNQPHTHSLEAPFLAATPFISIQTLSLSLGPVLNE